MTWGNMHVAIFMSWFLFGFLHHLVDVAGEECNDNYFNLHTIICLFFFFWCCWFPNILMWKRLLFSVTNCRRATWKSRTKVLMVFFFFQNYECFIYWICVKNEASAHWMWLNVVENWTVWFKMTPVVHCVIELHLFSTDKKTVLPWISPLAERGGVINNPSASTSGGKDIRVLKNV